MEMSNLIQHWQSSCENLIQSKHPFSLFSFLSKIHMAEESDSRPTESTPDNKTQSWKDVKLSDLLFLPGSYCFLACIPCTYFHVSFRFPSQGHRLHSCHLERLHTYVKKSSFITGRKKSPEIQPPFEMVKTCMFHYRKQTKRAGKILLWNSKLVRAEMSLTLSAVKAFWKPYQKLLKHFKNLNTGQLWDIGISPASVSRRYFIGLFKAYILEICWLHWHWYLNLPTDLLSQLELKQDRDSIRS